MKTFRNTSKGYTRLIVVAFYVILITGCNHQATTRQTALSPNNQTLSLKKDIDDQSVCDDEMQMTLQINDINNEQINFTLINEGSERAYYGSQYYLEMYQDGKWIDIRYTVTKDESFTDVLTLLSSGEEASRIVVLSNPLQVGRYRLWKQVEKEDSSRYAVCIEFDVIEKEDTSANQ